MRMIPTLLPFRNTSDRTYGMSVSTEKKDEQNNFCSNCIEWETNIVDIKYTYAGTYVKFSGKLRDDNKCIHIYRMYHDLKEQKPNQTKRRK